MHRKLVQFSLILSAILASGCASIPVEHRAQMRSEINATVAESMEAFAAEYPSLQEAIDHSAGYYVGTGRTSMLGVAGYFDCVGVLYDRAQNSRTYLNIEEFSVGVGLGSADLQVVVVVKSVETLEQLKKGKWAPSAELVSIGGESETYSSWDSEELSVFIRSESGALAAADLGLARIYVNTDLTDVGVSNIQIPYRPDRRGTPRDDDAPRIWPHRLPFLAQNVIDKGYDLPLPYGVSLFYVDTRQDMVLTNILVGINGSEKREFPILAIENASSETQTFQLKVDTWILPFMNVFAIFGKVDGEAPLDVILDGNAVLEDREIDCSGIINSPLCDLLEDRRLTVPVTANLEVTNWGFGTVLAAGWRGWFAALPMSITFAEREGSVTVGETITASPRVGRVFSLGNLGNLMLFAGGSYLKADYTIDGVFSPTESLALSYTVKQDNADPWNVHAGFVWDVSKRLSWIVEYDGFTGSRDVFITSLNARF